jgi:hypothetical protein
VYTHLKPLSPNASHDTTRIIKNIPSKTTLKKFVFALSNATFSCKGFYIKSFDRHLAAIMMELIPAFFAISIILTTLP